MDTSRIIQWTLVITLIIWLSYTMFVVKNEKKTYLQNAKTINFAGLRLLIPHWWTQEINTNEKISFYRSDTRYDWKGIFKVVNDDISLHEIMEKEKIVFDPHELQEKNPQHSLSQNYNISMLEGTGTKDHTDRVYIQAFLLKSKNKETNLLGISHSSVLNGGIEGPYFEEVFNGLTQFKP